MSCRVRSTRHAKPSGSSPRATVLGDADRGCPHYPHGTPPAEHASRRAPFARANVPGNITTLFPALPDPALLTEVAGQLPRQRPQWNGDPVSAAIASRYSANAALTGRRLYFSGPGSERAADSTLQSVSRRTQALP